MSLWKKFTNSMNLNSRSEINNESQKELEKTQRELHKLVIDGAESIRRSIKKILVFEILRLNANAEEIQHITTFHKSAGHHPDIFLQTVLPNPDKNEEERFNVISKSYKNVKQIVKSNNLSIAINIKKDYNLYLNSVSIKIPFFEKGKFVRWNKEENFELFSKEVLINSKELNKLLKEYLSSGRERKDLEKARIKQNNQLKNEAIEELNRKSREEALNKRKEEKENAKRRWPEVKKKINEMNRRAGLIK